MRKTIAKAAAAGLLGLLSLGIGAEARADTNVQASNSCEDCEVETGNATSGNSAVTFTGQANGGGINAQKGNNETEADQDAQSTSGDGVTGQVIGSAGSGDTTIVASNSGKDNKVTTGDANAGNGLVSFTGQANGGGINFQDGDNETDSSQAADSTTGDGVTGQVIGVL
ncbi:MAG: hypothetical protein WD646_11785 [Actinomycetota bacterium]